jgi:hypothetical protein
MANTTVYNGINGKITCSGNVIGGCDTAEITVTRNVAEYGQIGQETMAIAAGIRSVSWSLKGAWAGSRWLPILQGTGSGWNLILEHSGAGTTAVMIASGCLATDGAWSMSAGEISTDSLSGRAVDFIASGTTMN